MNSKTKKRMIAVTGVIVIVLILVLAVVGGSTSAKSVTVAQAASGEVQNSKVKVSGNVVDDSITTDNDSVSFSIYDPEADTDAKTQLRVYYDKGVSATFGNGTVAICTGKIGSDGVLQCSDLVTKCPSKYENASDALTVSKLISYGEEVIDKPVKITGKVLSGSLKSADSAERLIVVDDETGDQMAVKYDGALSDGVKDDAVLVLTGSLAKDGSFTATDVALEG